MTLPSRNRSIAFALALTLAACAGSGQPDEATGGRSGSAGAAGSAAAGAAGSNVAGATGGGDVAGARAGAGQGGSAPLAGGGGAGTAGGGSAGSAGSAGTSTRATFSTDFEADAIPAAAAFFPEYQRANASSFVKLDASVAHSGTKSLKVSGTDFSQMLGVPVPGPKFWIRVYLRSDTDIQEGHNTYVAAVEGNGDPNAGQAVRIGEHECQLELNRKSDDKELLSNGGTYMCSGGVKLVANKWACLEALYDGAGGEVRVFVDGAEIDKLHATGWGPYDYKLFKFGFEKYHGAAKTLWYDDVAVGPDRIGCTP